MQISFRSTVRSMVRNMKETFQPKPGMQKKQVLQDPESTLSIHAACNDIRSHPNSFHCIC